jgi:uncharacterized protein with ParB-like and HNH nuclease domain
MGTSTTITRMFCGKRIYVPLSQKPYSWEAPVDNIKQFTQTDIFLSILEDLEKNSAQPSYFFGLFLFEEKSDSTFEVIDGQQRLTTIVILLSALFSRLKYFRALTDNEEILFENFIKRRSIYIFSTVEDDNQLFKDYVIDQIKKSHTGLVTESAKCIVDAFDFFHKSIIR